MNMAAISGKFTSQDLKLLRQPCMAHNCRSAMAYVDAAMLSPRQNPVNNVWSDRSIDENGVSTSVGSLELPSCILNTIADTYKKIAINKITDAVARVAATMDFTTVSNAG